jgi:hypothetical protein
MFEPGVPNKRPHHHATTYRAHVCLPQAEGRGPPWACAELTPGFREAKPYLLKQAPSFLLEAVWKFPVLDLLIHSQAALLSDQDELRAPVREVE